MAEPILSGPDDHVSRRAGARLRDGARRDLLWGINGTVAKATLGAGLSSLRLTEVRSTGAARPPRSGARRHPALAAPRARGELLFLLAVRHLRPRARPVVYFFAIHRLQIGIALLIQYLAPVLIALWARFVTKEPVRRRIWAALILSLGGLSLVVDLWSGFASTRSERPPRSGRRSVRPLHPAGRARRRPHATRSRSSRSASLLRRSSGPSSSRGGRSRSASGRPCAARRRPARHDEPGLVPDADVILVGTIVPFLLLVGALRHISATRAGVTAMFEPVAGALVAYAWLGSRSRLSSSPAERSSSPGSCSLKQLDSSCKLREIL